MIPWETAGYWTKVVFHDHYGSEASAGVETTPKHADGDHITIVSNPDKPERAALKSRGVGI